MFISFNWGKLDTNITPNNEWVNKIFVATFDDSNNQLPYITTYQLPTNLGSSSQSNFSGQILGISNLIGSQNTNSLPSAVVLSTSNDQNQNSIWFSFLKLDKSFDKTANSTTLDQYQFWNKWGSYNAGDKIAYNFNAVNNGVKNNSSFYYVQIQKEDSNNTVSTNNFFFSLEKQNDNIFNLVNLYLNDFQIGLSQRQLESNYCATNVNNNFNLDSISNPNCWINNNSKNDFLQSYLQVLSFQVLNDNTINTATKPIIDSSLIDLDKTTNNLVQDSLNATIKGSINVVLNNWWNNETTTIVKNINLTLNKADEFHFDLSTINDNRSKFVESKYSISDFNAIAFLNDGLESYNISLPLKQLLLNQLDQNNNQLIQVTKNSNSVTINYDLSSLKIDSAIIPLNLQSGKLTYSNFANTTNNDLTYNNWISSQENVNLPIWIIPVIIFVILVLILIIVILLFKTFKKKKKFRTIKKMKKS